MNKILLILILVIFPTFSNAEEIPDQNAAGMKKVNGVIINIDHVDSSRRGSATSGIPAADLVESIFGSNYSGFPIYFVKVSEAITIDVASKESYKIGDCVMVWYDEAMGDSPSLSMLGQAGISKSNTCSK
jgi:hypothetical protein